MNECEACGKEVDVLRDVHVRAGIVEYFNGGKMMKAKQWHLRCWAPGLPEYNPAEEAPAEYRA